MCGGSWLYFVYLLSLELSESGLGAERWRRHDDGSEMLLKNLRNMALRSLRSANADRSVVSSTEEYGISRVLIIMRVAVF